MESILDNSELIASVINDWWYYSVELAPGVVTKGMDTPQTPMLPRMMLRNCNLNNMECLDIGSMEGLIPAMMVRKGARRVLATDALPHCQKKMDVLRKIYNVNFDFRQIGLLYDLSTKLKDQGGFDFINLSGVLYHVFSPMHVLAGIRPLLKKNGLMVISTNVMNREGNTLEFNARGSLQAETNTFWYHSVPMLESLIRYFKLVPIDFLFCPHTEVNPYTYVPGLNSGYMSVVCRAVDSPEMEAADAWASGSRMSSWEFLSLCNGQMMAGQPQSTISYRTDDDRQAVDVHGMHLMDHINDPKRVVATVTDSRSSQTLHLSDMF
jgi:2-polyprenyl-3-methyl-5-hydroxy-6-metoxy-1,4-benzoquinol methylase